MAEISAPYNYCRKNAIEPAVKYIEPTDAQLQGVIAALKNGRLDFFEVQNYGSSNGGTSSASDPIVLPDTEDDSSLTAYRIHFQIFRLYMCRAVACLIIARPELLQIMAQCGLAGSIKRR